MPSRGVKGPEKGTSIGNDDLQIGDFYWDLPNDIWRVGDRAELRDAQERLISFFIVPDQR